MLKSYFEAVVLNSMKERISGLQDIGLAITPQRVDDILERTDLANDDFQAKVHRLRHDEDTFTEQEIKKARQAIDEVLFPRHHPKTPLPNPRQ